MRHSEFRELFDLREHHYQLSDEHAPINHLGMIMGLSGVEINNMDSDTREELAWLRDNIQGQWALYDIMIGRTSKFSNDNPLLQFYFTNQYIVGFQCEIDAAAYVMYTGRPLFTADQYSLNIHRNMVCVLLR